MKFDITNADLHLMKPNPCPSDCKRGTIIEVRKTLESCSFGFNKGTIEPGTYKIVDRKHFRGGYQTIEKV